MADIKITFSEVRNKAKAIQKSNDTLNQHLTDIKGAINALESVWTSDASDTIRAKITDMQPKFDNYYTIIKSYVTFLETTVSNYEATEQSINSNAAAFE
ncbi:MAG: WXG100 family type VII secretion target [Lachnospiraceae bacterium]|nr:WXG100 family type VII secretion target [Lachnospiraceae bacterium]